MLKKYYQNTNKQNPDGQLTKQDRRQTQAHCEIDLDAIYFKEVALEEEGTVQLEQYYWMSHSNHSMVNLATFLGQYIHGQSSHKGESPGV